MDAKPRINPEFVRLSLVMDSIAKASCEDKRQFVTHVRNCLDEGIVNRLQIANQFTTSLNTADRWVLGLGIPHPEVRKHVFKYLIEMVGKKMKELP